MLDWIYIKHIYKHKHNLITIAPITQLLVFRVSCYWWSQMSGKTEQHKCKMCSFQQSLKEIKHRHIHSNLHIHKYSDANKHRTQFNIDIVVQGSVRFFFLLNNANYYSKDALNWSSDSQSIYDITKVLINDVLFLFIEQFWKKCNCFQHW